MAEEVEDRATLRWVAKEMYQRAASSKDTALIMNAAAVVYLFDERRAVALLQRLLEIDPSVTTARLELAEAYRRLGRRCIGEERRQFGVLAYAQFSKLLDGSPEERRPYFFVRLAESAYYADDLHEAERWAEASLAYADRQSTAGDAGDKYHHGNIVLGLVALQRGDLNLARDHLRVACRGSSSPVLTSFGPDMALAQELLNRGARPDVIEFLTDCEKIWPAGTTLLERWISEIRSGKTPELDKYAPLRAAPLNGIP